MKERDYGSCIEGIIEHMNYAEEFIKYMTFEELSNDKKTVLSLTKCIEVVGEATSMFQIRLEKISGDSLARYGGNQRSACPWYFKVNLEIIWTTVTMEFPELRQMMERVLADVDL